MKELETIAKNIVLLRKAKGLTQEDLCGLAEIDRSYLSEIENAKANISIKTLTAIANALDVELIDIVAEKT